MPPTDRVVDVIIRVIVIHACTEHRTRTPSPGTRVAAHDDASIKCAGAMTALGAVHSIARVYVACPTLGDDLDDEDQAGLHAALDAAHDELRGGKGIPGWNLALRHGEL